jgi:hypothetical protein
MAGAPLLVDLGAGTLRQAITPRLMLASRLLVVVSLVIGCSSTRATSTPESPSGQPSLLTFSTPSPEVNTPSPVASIRRATTPPAVLDRVSFAGSGSKRSGSLVLAGDYRFADDITTKPGCKWSVSIIPGFEELDSVTTDAGGTQSTESDLLGVDRGSYVIDVTSANCGRWSVSLTRE